MVPFLLLTHRGDRSRDGGALSSNICDAETQCLHRIALGMDRSFVANGIFFDTIFCMVNSRLKKLAQACVTGLAIAALKGCYKME